MEEAFMAPAAIYGVLAALTLVYLFQIGRPGLKRKILYVIFALGWPAYWLFIGKPKAAALVFMRFLFGAFLAVSLVLLLPFLWLERRGVV